MKLFAASALAIGLFAVPAMAADMAPAPTYSWDGVYIGVVGGYTWNNFDVSNIKFRTCRATPTFRAVILT